MTNTEGTEAAAPIEEIERLRRAILATGEVLRKPGTYREAFDALATLEAALQQARDERDSFERGLKIERKTAADSMAEAEATIERLRVEVATNHQRAVDKQATIERLRAERETLLDQDRTNELQREVERLEAERHALEVRSLREAADNRATIERLRKLAWLLVPPKWEECLERIQAIRAALNEGNQG